MKSIQYIIVLFVLSWSGTAQAQQELSLHFTDHLTQSNQTNPALFAPNKFTVTGPSLSGNAYHSAFSFNDFASWQGNTLQVRWADAINAMSDIDNVLMTNINYELFGLQFKVKDNLQISLFQNTNFDQRLVYSKSIAELFYYGNGSNLDQVQQVTPAYDLLAYNEFGLGLAYKANEKLSIGARLKYLAGIGAVSTERSLATIHTDPEYYQLTFNTDMLIHVGGASLPDVDLENINLDSLKIERSLGGNSGFGIDLGISFALSDKIQLGASIRDLGSINWKENSISLESNGSYEFDGFDVDDLIDSNSSESTISQVVDSLSNALKFTESDGEFKTPLTTQFALSAKYKLPSRMSISALLYADMRQERWNPALAVNWQKQVKNWLNFGVMAGVRQGGTANLGLNGTLNLGFLQLYAMTDNVAPLFNYKNAKHANIRIGANLIFGRKKMNEKKEEELKKAEEGTNEAILYDRRQKEG